MVFPQITCCIVCEGVREEIMHKHILLGVFGVAPYVQIGIKDFSLQIPLWFSFFGGAGEGKFRCSLELRDESNTLLSNQALSSSLEGELAPHKISTSIFLPFNGLLTRPGNYRIGLLVNDREHYSSTMRIAPFV
jgi:hypothetical protein